MLFIELVFSLLENPIDRPHNKPTAVQKRHKTDRTKSTPDSKWDQAPAADDNTLLFTPGLELWSWKSNERALRIFDLEQANRDLINKLEETLERFACSNPVSSGGLTHPQFLQESYVSACWYRFCE